MRMVRGMCNEKTICLPTQLYVILSVRVGKKFVLTLSEELDVIPGQNWNSESVIIFHTVILQHI